MDLYVSCGNRFFSSLKLACASSLSTKPKIKPIVNCKFLLANSLEHNTKPNANINFCNADKTCRQTFSTKNTSLTLPLQTLQSKVQTKGNTSARNQTLNLACADTRKQESEIKGGHEKPALTKHRICDIDLYMSVYIYICIHMTYGC